MFAACTEEKDAELGKEAASVLVSCVTSAAAPEAIAECKSKVDKNKLPNLAWMFEANPTPPADFDPTKLSEYEKAFYEVLTSSQDAMNKAGITIPDVGGSSESSFSKDASGTPILTIDALPSDVMQAITASGTTKVSIYGRVHGTDTWLGGDTSSIAQTPITIRFPAEVTADYLEPLSTFTDGAHTNNLTVNPPDAKYVEGRIITTTNSASNRPNFLQKYGRTADGEAGELYWYVDKDVSIKGNYTYCSSAQDNTCTNIKTITFTLTLKTGWNKVFIEEGDNNTNYTQTPPSSMNLSWWRFGEYK
jgi:hypothetical protein